MLLGLVFYSIFALSSKVSVVLLDPAVTRSLTKGAILNYDYYYTENLAIFLTFIEKQIYEIRRRKSLTIQNKNSPTMPLASFSPGIFHFHPPPLLSGTEA